MSRCLSHETGRGSLKCRTAPSGPAQPRPTAAPEGGHEMVSGEDRLVYGCACATMQGY